MPRIIISKEEDGKRTIKLDNVKMYIDPNIEGRLFKMFDLLRDLEEGSNRLSEINNLRQLNERMGISTVELDNLEIETKKVILDKIDEFYSK